MKYLHQTERGHGSRRPTRVSSFQMSWCKALRFEGYRTGSDREVRIGFKVGCSRWRFYIRLVDTPCCRAGSKQKKTELMDTIRVFCLFRNVDDVLMCLLPGI